MTPEQHKEVSELFREAFYAFDSLNNALKKHRTDARYEDSWVLVTSMYELLKLSRRLFPPFPS